MQLFEIKRIKDLNRKGFVSVVGNDSFLMLNVFFKISFHLKLKCACD